MKIARVLQGFISRKVVKQTVMTVVYGVTRYGGRLQMEKRLKETEEFPEVSWLPWPSPAAFCLALGPCWERYWHCPSCGFPSCLSLSLPPRSQLAEGRAGLSPRVQPAG